MLHPDKALKIILNTNIKLGKEKIPVINSVGRIIAEDIYSGIEYPAFNKSAMDGYAYNSADDSDKFRVIETIPAGYISSKIINKGECAKIMTGASVPQGADKVVRVEYTEEKNGYVKILKPEERINICYKGEDLKTGDKILEAGAKIRPQEIATLSTIGLSEVPVYKQPIIGLITTGSEIVNPGEQITPGKIYNSNGPQLYSQIQSVPAVCKYYGIAEDDKQVITGFLEKAFSECDIVIISGGVSMGDYDFVPEVLKNLSVDIKFEKVAVKPGKPLVFGQKENKFVFGFPGNPVSSFLSFNTFVIPLIFKLMGHQYSPIIYRGELKETIKKTDAERVEYKPVYFDGKTINTIKYHGSGHINALSVANAIIKIEQGISELKQGQVVDVRQL